MEWIFAPSIRCHWKELGLQPQIYQKFQVPHLTVENFQFLNKVSSISPLKIEKNLAPLKFLCVHACV